MNVEEWNKLVMDNLNYAQIDSGFTSNDTNTTLILNAIKQTELLKEILAEQKLGMKSIELVVHNQLASFNREIEGIIRRSR
jgi:hypothetical protein